VISRAAGRYAGSAVPPEHKEVALFDRILEQLERRSPAPEAEAHCDAPCGVYDPASARIAAEAVLSLTKKILALAPPAAGDTAANVAYQNTLTRYILIKEEQAHLAKRDLLVLWTDYF
jgi:nickel superoxide dismutase